MANKKLKASALVVTMMVMGVILIVSLSIAVVTLSERRSSIGETKSNAAFQNSQSGMEIVMSKVNDLNITTVGGLIGDNLDCEPNGNLKNEDTGYEMKLMYEDGTPISCLDNAGESVSKIAQVLVVGTNADQQRAIKATPECYGASIDTDLVGHWKFDGDETTGYEDEILGNSATACVDGVNNHDNIDSSPTFDDVGRPTGYIKFNDEEDTNCAMISHKDEYKLQEGTVSFWVRYHNDEGTVFSKDADGCWTGTNPENTDDQAFKDHCIPSRAEDDKECDCGHLQIGWSWLSTADKLQVRFQNDGNGTHEALVSDNYPDPNSDNEWHLVTLTFSKNKYLLYIDAELDRQLNYGDKDDLDNEADNDGIMEALNGNIWHIWLGASYEDVSYAQADMDDLRIYDKVLSKCEIKELFRKKGQ